MKAKTNIQSVTKRLGSPALKGGMLCFVFNKSPFSTNVSLPKTINLFHYTSDCLALLGKNKYDEVSPCLAV